MPRGEKEFREPTNRRPHKPPVRKDHPANFVKAIPSRSPFALFLRTVENSPSLAQIVQTAKLARPFADKAVNAAVNLLFEKLPHLRKLTIDAHQRDGAYEATFFKRNPMDLPRHVELIGLNGSSGILGTFLQQSQIESIMAQGGCLGLLMPDCATRNTSSLLNFHMLHGSVCDDVSESQLELILAWPRALEQLHCSFPTGRVWSVWQKGVGDPATLLRSCNLFRSR